MQKRINMIVCGHIDHGKSTFVGKLMSELGLIPQDRLAFLKNNSKDSRIEYSHLIDSLADEKSKGITISLSQMAFKYQDQEYAFLDAPGHFEFMQNMIAGAAKADMAFLIVDALEGIKESTLRHLYSLSFIGVQNLYILMNKMDLVNYSESTFNDLKKQLASKCHELSLAPAGYIPISAYLGENLKQSSTKIPWYQGPTVASTLEKIKSLKQSTESNHALRFVVHDIYPMDQDNMIVGELLTGQIFDNTTLFLRNQTEQKTVSLRLLPKKQDLPFPIYNGEKYKTFFTDTQDLKIQRGSVLFDQASSPPHYTHRFMVSIFNFGQQNIADGDQIQIKLAKQSVSAVIQKIERLYNCADLNFTQSLETENQVRNQAAASVPKGHVALCLIETHKPITCELFEDNHTLGRLVIIKDHMISAAGKITKLMT